MYKGLFTFLCESSSVDGNDGKLSAYKLFEEVNISGANQDVVSNGALINFKFDLLSGWLIEDPSSRAITVSVTKHIINPDGEEIAKGITSAELPPNQTRFNIRENITELPVKGFGDYLMKVILTVDGQIVGEASYPFRVNFIGENSVITSS